MGATVFHSKTATTPDVTTAEIRPSHWNEAHIVSISLQSTEVVKAFSAGTSSMSSGNLTFSNSNGITFGLSNGVLTGSHNGITSQSVQTQGLIAGVIAGGNTVSGGSVSFSNANGLSFGLNGSTLTGSYTVPTQTAQSVGVYASSQTTGQSSSSTVDARSLSIVGAGGVSVGLSGGSVVISGASGGGSDGFNRLAAGTQTAGSATTVQFADSNGITFGMSGSNQITASHDGLRSHRVSAANGSSSVAGISFTNSNGVSFSVTNGSIVASISAPSGELGIYASGNTTGTSSSAVPASSLDIVGAGIASVGFSDGKLHISVPGGGGGGFTAYATGNTAGDASSTTFAQSSLVMRGAGVASVGYSAGEVVISVPAGGGGGDGANFLAAGTQTATSLGSVRFENSNGVSFGMSGSTRITATVRTDYASSDHSHGFSAAGGSSAFQTLSFANSNGVSFSNSNGSLVGSVATTYAASNHSHGNPTLALTNLSGTTASNSAGFTLSLSAAAGGGGADGGVGISAGANSVSAGTVVFSNSNGVSFGLNGSTVTASHNGLTTAALSNHSHGDPTLALTNLSGTTGSASNGFTLSLSAASQTVQTIGFYASSQTTAQSSSSTVDARSITFRGAGVVSVGMSGGEVVISATAAGGGGADGGVFISAAGSSQTAGNIIFSNSNGVSFGMNGSTVTASHNGLTTAAVSNHSHGFSAQGGSSAFQTLSFSNTNGVSFSNSNGQVVASVATTYAASNHSHGNPTLALTNLSGTTASNSAGLTLSLSANAPGAATLTISGVGNTTVNSSGTWANALSVRAYGVLSIGTSNGSLLLSTPDAVDFTQLSVGMSTNGNTAGDTGLVTARLALVGGANITLSGSTDGGSMSISIIGGAGGGGGVALSAGANSVSNGTVVFSNSNGVSFGLNGSTVTASHNGLTSQSNQALSAGNGSFAFQTASFSNANGISFSTSAGSAIVASHNGLTSQSGQALSAANGSFAFQTASFSNANGVSFGTSAGSAITASVAAQSNQSGGIYALGNTTGQSSSSTYDARTLSIEGAGIVSVGWSNSSVRISATQSNQAASASNGAFTFQTLGFSNANNVTFGSSAGGIITASVSAQSVQSIGVYASSNTTAQSSSSTVDARSLSFRGAGGVSVGMSAGEVVISGGAGGAADGGVFISAAGSSQTAGNIVFSNSNGVSFGMNGSTVTASHNGLTTAALSNHSHGNPTLALTNLSGTTASNSAGLTLSLSAAAAGGANSLTMYAVGNTTLSSSGTVAGSAYSIAGSGGMSVGVSGASMIVSAPTISSLSATGQLSISTNGSTISIGVPNPSTDTGGFFPCADLELITHQQGNGTILFDPETFPNIAFDRIAIPLFHSNTSNSSGSHTLSVVFGLYSRNGSSLSLISSTSGSTNFTASGTVGSYSLYSGIRLMTIPMTMTVTAGKYWMGFASITTTGGAAGQTVAHMAVSNIASNFVGLLGQAHTTTQQFTLGQGVYTATSSGMPASVAFSQIRGSDSAAQRPPALMFCNGTVP